MKLAALFVTLAAFAAVVGSAAAAIPAGNLLANPGAEEGAAATDAGTAFAPPQWAATTGFTQVVYGTSGFPTAADSTAFGGGNAFFAGGTGGIPVATADQGIDVSGAAPEIDAGGVTAQLSAYLGGFSTQTDDATVTAEFLGANQSSLGALVIGPVTPSDRGDVTAMLPRGGTGAVPAGTRSIVVRITANLRQGSYNDGYADNVALTLTGSTVGGGGNPPPPASVEEARRKTIEDLPVPVLGRNANVEPVSGTVLVALPLGAAQKGRKFVSLKEARQIPVGSFLDTRKGTVRLQTATGAANKTQLGKFSAGLFQTLQSRKESEKGLTELRLKGSRFDACGAKTGKPASAALSKKALRRLTGNAKGRFRTRGRFSAATVRGTKWTVTDRCDGTLTQVTRGKVAVRDFRRKRTILVRTGKSYLARAKR